LIKLRRTQKCAFYLFWATLYSVHANVCANSGVSKCHIFHGFATAMACFSNVSRQSKMTPGTFIYSAISRTMPSTVSFRITWL